MTLSNGTKLNGGRYTILEKLEIEGGHAVIYKAKDKDLNNEIVAIKASKENADKVIYRELLERLKREKTTLNKLISHPNIVKYYEYFQEKEVHYLVMEFIDGRNLKQLIQEDGKLKYQYAFDYIYQIGLALKYAHDKNLIHRDVHPKNIMIEKTKRKNRAVLIDFGIVKIKGLDTSWHPSIANFTHHEQRKGDYNTKFDVYGLAACLYKVLTEHDPEDSEDRFHKYNREKQDLITPPRKHNSEIRKDVEKAILKGMALKLEEIPSMEEWLNQLPKPLDWRWQQLMKVKRWIVNQLRNFFR